MFNKLLPALTILSATFSVQSALAWGHRGHHTICEAAVHLVQSKPLKEFLLTRTHVMGHLCNIPDIYWKSLSSEARKHGDAAHFIDIEILGIPFKDVPTDYKVLVSKYTNKENMHKRNTQIFSIPEELGSSWWRADQFYRLALKDAEELVTSPAPTSSKEAQNNDLPYNKHTYSMLVNMGLMGHFVGDNAQPFHTTFDYDGYEANHGGIHSYYEEQTVSFFGPDMTERIVKKAKDLDDEKFMKAKLSVIERMRALAELTFKDKKIAFKLDPVTVPSTYRAEKEVSIKSAAKRASAEDGFKKFEKLQIEEMARASVLLASLWDKIYTDAGRPDLAAYKSYKYPFTPDFVMPDYYDVKAEDEKKPAK